MQSSSNSRYIFSSYANAVGAMIDTPSKAFLPDTPSAALAVTGGLVSSVKENMVLRIDSLEVLRIGRAAATVLGGFRKEPAEHFVSMATSAVEKVNLLDIVTADAIVSKVTSVYTRGVGTLFYFAGSHFDNLKINGKPYNFDYDEEPAALLTIPGSILKRKEGFQLKDADRLGQCLFHDKPFRVVVPQFGTVVLGEVDIYGAKAILTMLRAELGCPVEGRVALATTSTNGTDAP